MSIKRIEKTYKAWKSLHKCDCGGDIYCTSFRKNIEGYLFTCNYCREQKELFIKNKGNIEIKLKKHLEKEE